MDNIATTNTELKLTVVPTRILEHLLAVAREGKEQRVQFSRDNNVMAMRAAVKSKEKCSALIEMLLAVLTGNEIELIGLDED